MKQTDETEAKIEGLHDKNDYKFRVAAVNAIGQGPWADLGPITCKSPHGMVTLSIFRMLIVVNKSLNRK